jgi:glycosyltransferase involved in cell wall biosynthesis
MNILISLPYFPLENTGTGNSVYGLAKGLISAGANVMILSESKKYSKSSQYKTLSYKKVPYIEFPKKKSINPFKVSDTLLQYLEINRNKIDLLLINGIFVPYVYKLAMYAKKLNIPYIHIPHGVYNKRSFIKSKFKKKIYFSLFEKKVIENALAVQMFSKGQFIDLKKIANPKNIIIVPNVVDLSLLDNFNPIKEKNNDKIKAIFWGRKDIFIKGLDLLVKAFSQIDFNNIELYIQGADIGDTSKLEKLIYDLNLSNIYLKSKFNGNPLEALQQYDFMIMPSRLEAFSMAVIEGMLAELPILISKEVGAAEYVESANAGIICDPTVSGIREGIINMLAIKERWKEMGKNGKEYVLKNLTWEIIGKNALEEYKKLLNDK